MKALLTALAKAGKLQEAKEGAKKVMEERVEQHKKSKKKAKD